MRHVPSVSRAVTPRPPRRGQIRTVISEPSRQVVIYSGNMLNDIPGEHVITMDVVDQTEALCVEVSDNSWIRYTWLDHFANEELGEVVGEVSEDLMSTVNTRLFMVIATS